MDMDMNKYNEISEILKALAHPVRLCIVRGLLEKGGCNVCHMQECLGMPQSTTSQHLQKLRAAGIISGQRKGLEVTYKVCDQRIAELIKLLFPEQK